MTSRDSNNLVHPVARGVLRLSARTMMVLAFVGAATASAKVAPTTVENLFRVSDRVVVGRIVKVEKLAGFKWARVEVTQNIKGAGADQILFLAEPTWTCDTSSATVGDEALLFLSDASNPDTSWHFKTPDRQKLPANAFLITWSGRGQMPLRTVDGQRFATAWNDVAIPDHILRIPGPEPEYSFIESVRLADLLELLERFSRHARSFEGRSDSPRRHREHRVGRRLF